MSSKCLLFPIFIYKVDNENCCVYNSNVAINVTILITSSRLSVFSFQFPHLDPWKRATIVHQGAVSANPLSTPVVNSGVSRKRLPTPDCIGAGVCSDRRPGQVVSSSQCHHQQPFWSRSIYINKHPTPLDHVSSPSGSWRKKQTPHRKTLGVFLGRNSGFRIPGCSNSLRFRLKNLPSTVQRRCYP